MTAIINKKIELTPELITKNNETIMQMLSFVKVQCRNGYAWDFNKDGEVKINYHSKLIGKLTTETLPFHESMDALLLVIKTTEDFGYNYNITIMPNGTTIDTYPSICGYYKSGDRLLNTWLAMVEFAEKYIKMQTIVE